MNPKTIDAVESNLRMETGDHFKNGASPKSLMSRGNFLFNFVIAFLLASAAFMSCSKDKKDPVPGEPTLRYETVPYGSAGSKNSVKSGDEAYKLVFCSYDENDEERIYYLFVLGNVLRVPLACRDAVYYDGVTKPSIGYSSANVTQKTISSSVTTAIEHSVTESRSTDWNVGSEVGFDHWVVVKATATMGGSTGWDQTNTRSLSNTFDVSSLKASEIRDEISVRIGEEGEPPGSYRWSLFTTVDVYFVLVTDRAKTIVIEAYTVMCARKDQIWVIDYDPEFNGSFGKTAPGELLLIPEINLSELPDPKEEPALPKLTTDVITFTTTTATIGGNISNAGTPTYYERGVVYATTPNPTLASNKTVIEGTGTGSFSTTVSGLTPGEHYYVRAFATNTVETAFGDEVDFTTIDVEKYAYIDENGTAQTRPSVTRITPTTTQMSGGWYYVSGNVPVASRITVSGMVHIILEDGCNFTAEKGINVPNGSGLTIYAQSTGNNMGKLKAIGVNGTNGGNNTTGGRGGDAGIGGNGGNGAPNNSSSGSSGSSSGTIIINGGEVTAQGGKGGDGSSGWAYGGGGAGAGIGGGGGGGGGSTAGLGSNGKSGGGGGSSSDITINGGTVIAWWGDAGSGGARDGGNGGAGGGGRGAGIGGGGGGGGGGGYAAGGTGNTGSDGKDGDNIGSGGTGGGGGKGGTFMLVGGTNGGSGGSGGGSSKILYDSRKLSSGSGHVQIAY